MDVFSQLMTGFGAVMSLQNLIACFVGVFIGTVVGVLPGIGPAGVMALLLPFSFGMDAGASLILLGGIYYGAMYGGSTTSILINVPGEAASIVTCLDGHKMAKNGRAGAALSIAAIGSWVAGTVGVVLLMAFAPPLGKAALAFGPPEYLAISILAMLLLSNLSGGSFAKSILMFLAGMAIAVVGVDSLTGYNRLSFDILDLSRGIQLLPLVMGLFGLSEVLENALSPYNAGEISTIKLRDLYPNKTEMKRSVLPIVRGSLLGFPIGLIPGPAAILSSLISYKVEKGLSKHPEEFGNGAIEGVAGPESANNAAAAGAMVPLLALGIPFAPATAVLLGGFLIQGITPGPLFITQHANLFWLVIASMYVGNIMLLILNLPLVGLFASITRVPPRILMPIIMVIMLLGVYSDNSSLFDVGVLVVFGVLGFVLKLADYPLAPLVIGFVLEPVFEKSFRQSMIMAQDNALFVFQRPISGTLFAVIALVLVWIIVVGVKKRKLNLGK